MMMEQIRQDGETEQRARNRLEFARGVEQEISKARVCCFVVCCCHLAFRCAGAQFSLFAFPHCDTYAQLGEVFSRFTALIVDQVRGANSKHVWSGDRGVFTLLRSQCCAAGATG